jgi:hypothetical protein
LGTGPILDFTFDGKTICALMITEGNKQKRQSPLTLPYKVLLWLRGLQ